MSQFNENSANITITTSTSLFGEIPLKPMISEQPDEITDFLNKKWKFQEPEVVQSEAPKIVISDTSNGLSEKRKQVATNRTILKNTTGSKIFQLFQNLKPTTETRSIPKEADPKTKTVPNPKRKLAF